MIRPFEVNVPESDLEDLKNRVSQTRWPDEVKDAGWTFGANSAYMKELSLYWQNDFDWREIEEQINAFPNFIAHIEQHEIHFLHIKGKGKQTIPLLITHGWPGSFLEMFKLIPLLTEIEELSFDLVIPSVPGFGFSSAHNEKGCDNDFVAEYWHKLMLKLGYQKYGAQGGDIGSGISTRLAQMHPDHVIGLHLNYVSDSFRPPNHKTLKSSKDVQHYFNSLSEWESTEAGYAYIQATKPQTLSYGLNDSPVGLCAWIIEKMNAWSDHNDQLETLFTKDELLANVTLYWLTQSIRSSVHIYYENSQNPMAMGPDDFVTVPTAYANFPAEISRPPQNYMSDGYNLIRWTDMPKGGHFAAMEQPQLLADDIRSFFKSLYE